MDIKKYNIIKDVILQYEGCRLTSEMAYAMLSTMYDKIQTERLKERIKQLEDNISVG